MASPAPTTPRDDNMRGVLFINHRKEQDRHPDRTGEITVEGKKYKLSGWIKTKRDSSEQFLSLAVSEFQEPNRQASTTTNRPSDF